MSEKRPLPPKTTDALTPRNRLPYQLAMRCLKFMDRSGQKAIAEVILQGSRAVNRVHYEARCVDRSRLGLDERAGATPSPAPARATTAVRGRPPKTTDVFTRRNRLPFRLATASFKLMDASGQQAIAEVIRQGSRAVNDAWRAERERTSQELTDSGRLALRSGARNATT